MTGSRPIRMRARQLQRPIQRASSLRPHASLQRQWPPIHRGPSLAHRIPSNAGTGRRVARGCRASSCTLWMPSSTCSIRSVTPCEPECVASRTEHKRSPRAWDESALRAGRFATSLRRTPQLRVYAPRPLHEGCVMFARTSLLALLCCMAAGSATLQAPSPSPRAKNLFAPRRDASVAAATLAVLARRTDHARRRIAAEL